MTFHHRTGSLRGLSLALAMGAAALAFQPATAQAGQADNSLIVALGTDLVMADPANGALGTDIPVLYTLYDRLLDFAPEDLSLKPMLATEWSWSDDRKTLTLKLRQGVKFHDGTDFNAEAVKRSLEFFKESGVNRDINGVTKIEVVDPFTIALTSETPNSSLPGLLAERAGMIISPAAIDKWGKEKLTQNPVGTGPFKMRNHEVGSAVFVERFADYWDKDKQTVDLIEFRVIKNPASAVSAMMTGQIDYLPSIDPINMPALSRNPAIRVAQEPTIGYGVVQFNAALAPVDKAEVRRAISMSIDREEIAAAVYGGNVQTKGAVLPVPPSYWPSTPGLDTLAYNPDGAKKLLAEAGYPNGISFKMCLNANAGMPQPAVKVADIMREQMKPAGITLETEEVAANSACVETFVRQKKLPAFLVTWSGRPDPAITYAQMLATDSFYNVGGKPWGNRADELVRQLQATEGRDAQDKIYDELNKVFVDEVPMMPLYFFVNVVAYNANLTGEEPNLLGRPNVRTLHWKK